MHSKPSLHAVTFDAAGTLIRVAEPVGETYARIATDVGADLSPELLDDAFREAFPAMPAMAFPGVDGPALAGAERAWWRELVARVVRHAGGVREFDKFFDALFSYYASGSAWRAYPEVRRALESARARGLGIGVVSNFDSRLPRILRELGIEALVDSVVYSTGCGAAKPDKRIFAYALQTLGTTPASALHVGDSLHADYRGALGAGMAAVHLRRRNARSGEDIPTVRDLGELDAHLDRRR